MGSLRFHKKVWLLPPFLWVNLGKSGASLSVWLLLFTLNFSKRGVYLTFGLKGTGLSYRQKVA